MKKKSILKIIVKVLLVIIVLVLLLISFLLFSREFWVYKQKRQEKKVVELAINVEDDTRYFSEFLSKSLRFNEIQVIATHNSYHLQPDPVRMFLMGLVKSNEPSLLAYSHQTLPEQLDNGIRSFELDVRLQNDEYIISHVPLVDNLGPHPSMELTLKEIQRWSKAHPDHIPLTIIIEFKLDWMILEPGLKPVDDEFIMGFDELLRSTLDDERLYTPEDFRGKHSTMRDALTYQGWPLIEDLKGKILFVLHVEESTDSLYVNGDVSLGSHTLFTSCYPEDDREDAIFIVYNEPDASIIKPLVERGFIVRTRADADLNYSSDQREAALSSGAQIISTDFPPGHINGDIPPLVFSPGHIMRVIY